jgi:hypothetical protein
MPTGTKRTEDRKTRAESRTLLTLTLACYLTAFACVLTLGYSLAAFAAYDIGRRAAAAVSPYGL